MNADRSTTGKHVRSAVSHGRGGLRLMLGAAAVSASMSWAADQIDPETYQRTVDENIALRQEQTRLVRESSDLRKKNANLVLDIQELESKRDQLTALVAQLQTPEETRNELTRLQAERAVLVKEIERLRQSAHVVPNVPTNSPPSPPVAAPAPATPLFRKVEQENAELRQQVAQARETAQTAEKARSQAAAHDAEQQARAEKLSAEVATLRKELSLARGQEATLRQAIDKIARKSYQQQMDIAGLEKDLARSEAEREQSRRAAKAATQANPADTAGLLRGARRALNSGRAKEAEKLYLEALAQTPSDSFIHYNLGVVYSDYLADAGKAASHFRRYLELNPQARDASRVRAWVVELEIRAAE